MSGPFTEDPRLWWQEPAEEARAAIRANDRRRCLEVLERHGRDEVGKCTGWHKGAVPDWSLCPERARAQEWLDADAGQ